MTFSAPASIGANFDEQPVLAVLPTTADLGDGSVRGASESQTWTENLNVHYSPAERLHAHLSFNDSATRGLNLGIGGITLPEAGFQSALRSRDFHGSVNRTVARYTYRGGLVMTHVHSNMTANSERYGVAVPGSVVAGGGAVARSQSVRTRWTWKSVMAAPSPPGSWSTGVGSVAGAGTFGRPLAAHPGRSIRFWISFD